MPDPTRDDIHTLFERAKLSNAAALNAISDAAGDIIGLFWSSFDDTWARMIDAPRPSLDGEPIYEEEDEPWTYHGRHAPGRSADCALSVPMPKGYAMQLMMGMQIRRVSVWQHGVPHDPMGFNYTDPAHLPLALTSAALYANLHAKEKHDYPK